MSEEKTGISYNRLVEIATRLKDMLKEEHTGIEILKHLNNEYDLDLDENEIEFIGFFEDEESEMKCPICGNELGYETYYNGIDTAYCKLCTECGYNDAYYYNEEESEE